MIIGIGSVRHRRSVVLGVVASALLLSAFLLLSYRILILSNAVHSDYLLVLDGHDDAYYAGLNLLDRGYGKFMFVCLDIPDTPLIGEELRKDREFIRRTAKASADRIDLCRNDASEDLFQEIQRRLVQADAHSVLIVTPEGESRAEYVAARRALPRYSWSVFAVRDSRFGELWWSRRVWTATYLRSVFRLWEAYRTTPLTESEASRRSQ